jgi:hypothetical protein
MLPFFVPIVLIVDVLAASVNNVDTADTFDAVYTADTVNVTIYFKVVCLPINGLVNCDAWKWLSGCPASSARPTAISPAW